MLESDKSYEFEESANTRNITLLKDSSEAKQADSKQTKPWYMINPGSLYLFYWNIFQTVLILYLSIEIPLVLAFDIVKLVLLNNYRKKMLVSLCLTTSLMSYSL